MLPLVRKPFVASALVAGAVAPDLLYVDPIYRFATQAIHGNLTLTLTHQFSSVLWLDPLIALVILLLFHFVVRRPLVALAPPSLAGRLSSPNERWRIPTPMQLVWIVVSLVAGVFTHVLWDSFTHYDGYFVTHWSWLRYDLTAAWDVNRVLQYVSSVGGLLVIAIWLWSWWRRTTPSPIEPERYVPAPARYGVLAAAVIFGAVDAVVQVAREDTSQDAELVIRLGATGIFIGALVALAGYVVIWHLVRLNRLRKKSVTL